MKRQIRCRVFETNSSSTHSVSIYNRKTEAKEIPKDSRIVISTKQAEGTLYSELDKLNHVVTLLASIVEHKHDYGELEIKSFEEMISLSWFKWLAEAVKEESNTEIVYEQPTYWNGKEKTIVPYYDTTFDDDENIEDIFTDYNKTILLDEVKFKERVKDIIYNPTMIIEDVEEEY